MAVRKVVIPKTRLMTVSGAKPELLGAEMKIGVEFCARFTTREVSTTGRRLAYGRDRKGEGEKCLGTR